MSVSVDIEKTLGSFSLRVAFSGGDEVLALLGASGCGKSMTLKCIAGIEKPDRGRIELDGKVLFDSERKINLSPQERHTGLLFQNYALFPNMTVLQNIRAGARRETDRGRRDALVESILDRFGLRELLAHYPRQLSGGQQQRVALARILVSDPKILLLDEPFSALDSHLRFHLEQELRALLRRFGKSAILVSHDRDEVFRLADQILVLHDGSVKECGAKEEVFSRPQTRQGAILTGFKNISRIERLDAHRVRALDWKTELTLAEDAGQAQYIGIRMRDLDTQDGENRILCEVADEIENPLSCIVMLRPAGAADAVPFGWETDRETWKKMRAGQIPVRLPAEKLLPLRE